MVKKYREKITAKSIIFFLCFVLTSCTCANPLQVTPIQRSDKNLDCGQIILEITEAEQYRDYAMQQRGVSMGEALMPVCWATGFLDGGKAATRANERVEYLGRLYETRGCVNEGRPFFKRQSQKQGDDDDGNKNQQSPSQNQSYAPNYGSQQNYSRQPYMGQQNQMMQGRGGQSYSAPQSPMGQPNYGYQPNYNSPNYGSQMQQTQQQNFNRQPNYMTQPAMQNPNRGQPNMSRGHYKPKTEFGDADMHEHKNSKGDLYTHFHTHDKPHSHQGDQ